MTETAGRPSRPDDILSTVRAGLSRDDTRLGEPLMLLGALTAPLAQSCLVALDAGGAVVLLTVLSPVTRARAARFAEESDRVGSMSPEELHRSTDVPAGPSSLADRHAAHFGLPAPVELNRRRRLLPIVQRDMDGRAWDILAEELGTELDAVYLHEDGALRRLPVPEPERPTAPPPRRGRERARRPTTSLSTVLGIAALILGIGLILLAIATALTSPSGEEAQETLVELPIRTVATDVPSEATFTRWIDQQRVVRVGESQLLVVYPDADGLQIVADERNQGRTWRSAITVPEITAESVSVVADARDRLHVAAADGEEISYVRLDPRGGVWRANDPVVIDESLSEVVDIEYDDLRETAHVVWTRDNGRGQRPMWGAASTQQGQGEVVQLTPLAPLGAESGVLVNVGLFSDTRALVTYRKAEGSGWYSRIGEVNDLDGRYAWELEERLPTDAFIGAGSLAIDDRDFAHLVLRDDTNARLLYARRSPTRGWTSPDTIVDAGSPEAVDFPSVAVDLTSRLLYVFFIDGTAAEGLVRVAIRDPATGWEGPDALASAGELARGSTYSTGMNRVEGQAIVVWTTRGDPAAIQSARVSAP